MALTSAIRSTAEIALGSGSLRFLALSGHLMLWFQGSALNPKAEVIHNGQHFFNWLYCAVHVLTAFQNEIILKGIFKGYATA